MSTVNRRVSLQRARRKRPEWRAAARTWNALWSSLKNYTLSSPKATTRSWNPEALADMHSRMLQRLADLYQQRTNQTASFDGSSGLGALSNLTTAALTRSFFSGNGANSSFDLTAFNLTALMGGSSDVSSLLQRLKDDISKLDYNQLAKLAVLQGWALASMYSVYSMSSSKRSMPSPVLRRELPFDHPAQVTDPDWASFQPAVCLGLQNFGGAEGYRAAYLGPGPCGVPGSSVARELAWGSKVAFMLDCQPLQTGNATQRAVGGTENATTADGSSPGPGMSSAAGGSGGDAAQRRRSLLALSSLLTGSTVERQGAFSKLGSLLKSLGTGEGAGDEGRLACQAAITTSTGRGALLEAGSSPEAPALAVPGELNAVQIRVCNKAPSLLQGGPPMPLDGSSITLRDVRVGGKAMPLLEVPLTVTHSSHPDGCSTQLYKLGGKGLKGAGISGWIDLSDTSEFGVGDMASVVMSLGSYNPRSQGEVVAAPS
ncbi:hypothetical protein N2152v2_005572 [Parachlorella kessleri]